MTWVAVGVAGVTAAGSIYAGNKTAGAQKSASNSTIDEQRRQFDALQANQQPYMGYGQGAGGLGGLQALAGGDFSGFYDSPENKYQREMMVYGQDRSAAARGRLNSGGYAADLNANMAGLAAQQMGAYTGRLQWGANLGQNAAAGVGQAGMGMAGQIGNAYNNTANAQGTAYGVQGSSLGTLAGSIAGAFGSSPTTSSSYGGGSSAGNYGLPAPVAPYSANSYGSGGSYFG